MIDFHSHILPRLDDGSLNTDMTMDMLEDSVAAGVDVIVSTSHCYPKSYDHVVRFLNKRDKRFQELCYETEKRGAAVPKLLKAAEVNLITDFSNFDCLKDLCIENTNYILIEMPLSKWRDSDFDIIYSIILKGFRPIIAHIDRYAQLKNEFESFSELDLVFQLNADCFLSSAGRRFAYKMLRSGMGHVLGSDMHNTTSRRTHLGQAYHIIKKSFGTEYAEYLEENGKAILSNRAVDKNKFRTLPKTKRPPIFI